MGRWSETLFSGLRRGGSAMRFDHRLLAGFYRLLFWLGMGKWAVVLVLVPVGAASFFFSPNPVLIFLCAAVILLLVVGDLLAAWNDYTVFLPDPGASRPGADQPLPFSYGIATGLFWTWDRFRWLEPDLQCQVSVQVRWLAEEKPPILAVTLPLDLPPDIKNPLEEADEQSLWYPGVETTPGWMLTRKGLLPAIRFRYFGKRLILAVKHEEQVGAILAALTDPYQPS